MLEKVGEGFSWANGSGEGLYANWKAFRLDKPSKTLITSLQQMFPERIPQFVPVEIMVLGKVHSVRFKINHDLTYNVNNTTEKWIYTPTEPYQNAIPSCANYRIYLYKKVG